MSESNRFRFLSHKIMMLGKDEIKTIDQDTSLSDTIYVLRLKPFYKQNINVMQQYKYAGYANKSSSLYLQYAYNYKV